MNAVEIEEAVSDLAFARFDAPEFPFAFLTAFGNKDTTVKRLRAGSGNASDVTGGVLQRNNIHMAVCSEGAVSETLTILRNSPKTNSNKCKFILATDGVILEAEDLSSGETIACHYSKFGDHFGFFLPLAGISTVKQIKNNPIDIKATGRLNKLYIELLKDNPDWATSEKRHDLNQFMARLIFCFFAEDTGIFLNHLFSKTVEQMSDAQSGNTHEIISELFRAMNTPIEQRAAGNFRPWADGFPFVNGGLYAGNCDSPRFSRIARTYLLRAAELNWQEINPDIFGSMIQAVADDDERGELGMHYTSVPNILKVLNPLFLDDLRTALEAAGDNVRKLKNLRRRISRIRIFDPACGSGNFLVISYIQLRQIEAEIVRRIDDKAKSWIKLENFYGIEIKSFAAEIARLALLIAEFQCDVRLISQREARLNVLPLHKTGQIHIGNALRLNWLEVCPPANKTVTEEWDLGGPTGRLALEDNGLGETEEAETYICGNPPYKGSNWRTAEQKEDMATVFDKRIAGWKSLDYVAGWFIKAADYGVVNNAVTAFVSTNSVCQGEQVAILWPHILHTGHEICFAHTSFKWANLASHNAGVTVVVVGLKRNPDVIKSLFSQDGSGQSIVRLVPTINSYLLNAANVIVLPRKDAIAFSSRMTDGSGALDGGHLILSADERDRILACGEKYHRLVKRYYGSNELINGTSRWCLWIEDGDLELARSCPEILTKINSVEAFRRSGGTRAQTAISRPHKFAWINKPDKQQILVPTTFSEKRTYVTAGYYDADSIASNTASIIHNAPLWELAVISSRLHMTWVAAVAGKLEERLRYTPATCYNTFPMPKLTEKNKADLNNCAEAILLAREVHFPKTLAELYDPEDMPNNVVQAHERNDETIERIYIGRLFRNDTERLEKLFDLYTKTTEPPATKTPPVKTGKRQKA